MNSSIFITLLSLAIVGALAYFAAVGLGDLVKKKKCHQILPNTNLMMS